MFDKFTEWWTSLGLVKVLALTIPNDVHHSVNLSNKKCITYIYTSFYHFFLKKKYSNIFIWIILNVNSNLPPPDCFRRWTGPPFRTNQNNHTTTKNIVLVLCFVTVLCHIVNRSYMLNTVQHSYMIKVFLSINEEKTKPCWNTQ